MCERGKNKKWCNMVACACVLGKERLKTIRSVVDKKMVQCSVANQKREVQFQCISCMDAQYISDRTGIGQLFLMINIYISGIFICIGLKLLLKKLAQNVLYAVQTLYTKMFYINFKRKGIPLLALQLSLFFIFAA